MPEEMSKSQLIMEIQSEREQLEETLAQIDQERLTEPGAQDGWSVKDILAHIVAWETLMVGWVETTLRGDDPQVSFQDETWDLDQFNEGLYQENRHKPLEQVLAEFHASYPRALGVAQAVPEEDLFDPHRFPWRAGKPLWQLVAGNTSYHYKEHNQALRAWLEKGI